MYEDITIRYSRVKHFILSILALFFTILLGAIVHTIWKMDKGILFKLIVSIVPILVTIIPLYFFVIFFLRFSFAPKIISFYDKGVMAYLSEVGSLSKKKTLFMPWNNISDIKYWEDIMIYDDENDDKPVKGKVYDSFTFLVDKETINEDKKKLLNLKEVKSSNKILYKVIVSLNFAKGVNEKLNKEVYDYCLENIVLGKQQITEIED